MRQLTSLDAQFLAMESARTYGHVGGLAVYDPSTAPGGELTRRGHVPARRRAPAPAAAVPLAARRGAVRARPARTGSRTRTSTSTSTSARSAVPPPGDDRQLAETVARIFARPLDRTRPLWEIYLIHGPARGPRRAADEDPPRGGRRRLGRRDPQRPARPRAARARDDPARAGRAARASACRASSRCSAAACVGAAAPAAARAALAARRTLPDLADDARAWPRCPAWPTLTPRARAAALGADETARVLEATTAARRRRRRSTARSRAHRRFAFGSLSLDTRQGDQERARHHGQRRRRRAVRRRRARVAARARRAAGRPARRDGAGVGAHARSSAGTFGNRVSMMIVPIPTDEPDPRERLHAHARAAARRQGAPQRAARRRC